MAYADLATIQATDPGDPLTAAWCDQVRDNEEFLIDPPACSVFGVAQAVGHATASALLAASESFDNDSMHSTSSNTSRITVQTAGRYLFIASVGYAGNATGNRQAEFYLNGTPIGGATILDNSGASNSTGLTVGRMIVCAQGDYVETYVTQRSGGNLNCTLVEFAAVYFTR